MTLVPEPLAAPSAGTRPLAGLARAIVFLREHDQLFRAATVLLTGSSATDLAVSADLLHGRRGRWSRPLDRLHMPMSFRDYVASRAPVAVPPDRLSIDELLSPDGRDVFRTAALRTSELDHYLTEYLACGGLPAPMTDQMLDGTVHGTTTLELWRGIAADARRLNRSDEVLRKLVARTVVALSSTTEWSTLAHELDVTRPTVDAYVDVLGSSFALIVVPQRDPKR